MKSGRKAETKAHKEARLLYYEAVLATSYLYEDGCWFRHVVHHKCEGERQACHVLDKQGLYPLTTDPITRKKVLEKPELFIFDARNGLPGCQGIHGRFDTKVIRVYQDELPRGLFHFITDWEDALERPGVLEEKLDRKCPKGARP